MNRILGVIVFLWFAAGASAQAAITTYLVDVNSVASIVQLDIVTFAEISGQLNVNVSGADIWFTDASLSTASTPDEGYRLLVTAVGSYDGLDFSYQSGTIPGSDYSGTFDGSSLSLFTDGTFYSEIYGDVVSVSTVPLPGALLLFITGLAGLCAPRKFRH